MKRAFFTTILMLFVLAVSIKSESVSELITKGDEAYEKYDHKKALELFLKAHEAEPKNWEVLWRLSRTYVDLAENMKADTDEEKDKQLAQYRVAKDYADMAIEIEPNKSINYVRRSIALGRVALFKGVFSVGSVVDSVKNDCEKAISLGNGGSYVQGVAHYILARTHAKLAEKPSFVRWPLGLGWGDIDVALKEFEKAIKLYPDFVMFYFDYAKALISEDEYEKAREMLNKAISSTVKDEDDPKLKKEAKALLEEIKNE